MVAVDKEHQREAPFLWSLFKVIIDSSDAIIADPFDNLDQELAKLDDNLIFLLLEAKTSTHRNKLMIVVVVLCMLCYAHSERSNLLQTVNSQLLFAHNMPKQYIEIFHQMDLIVSYESFQHSLSTNAISVKKSLQNKATEKRFIVSYNNMNFYEK